MINLSNKRFFAALIAVLGISAFATLRSQTHPDMVRNVLLGGYGGLLLVAVCGGISISKEAWLLAIASAAQAIGYFKTEDTMDVLMPLQVALQTIVIVGLLPQLIDETVNLRMIMVGLLALAAVNYRASQGRYEIDLLADNRFYSNMIGGYGMLFAVIGFCLTDWTGMICLTVGGIILMLTSSRSAILGTIVGCGISAVFRYHHFDRKFIRFNMLALLCFPLIAYEGWNRLNEEGRESVRMQIEHALSPDIARAEKFNPAIAAGLESPWLGLGVYTSTSADAHNVWLAAFEGGGVLSFIFLIYAQFAVFQKLFLGRKEFWGCLSLAWFVAVLARSMFEGGTGVFSATGTNWTAVCTMFTVGLGLRLRPEEAWWYRRWIAKQKMESTSECH